MHIYNFGVRAQLSYHDQLWGFNKNGVKIILDFHKYVNVISSGCNISFVRIIFDFVGTGSCNGIDIPILPQGLLFKARKRGRITLAWPLCRSSWKGFTPTKFDGWAYGISMKFYVTCTWSISRFGRGYHHVWSFTVTTFSSCMSTTAKSLAIRGLPSFICTGYSGRPGPRLVCFWLNELTFTTNLSNIILSISKILSLEGILTVSTIPHPWRSWRPGGITLLLGLI